MDRDASLYEALTLFADRVGERIAAAIEKCIREQARPSHTSGSTLLTAEAVAELLGIPKRQVYELAKRGDLPCVPMGRRVLFRRQSVEAWLTSRERQGSQT